VENAGFGGAISAPIARELIRYYVKGEKVAVAPERKGNAPADSVLQADSTDTAIPAAVQPEKVINNAEPVTGERIDNKSGEVSE